MINKYAVIKLIIGGAAVISVAAGSAKLISDYRAGTGFIPQASDRELNDNIILFPEDDKGVQSAEADSSEADGAAFADNNTAEDSQTGTNGSSDHPYLLEQGDQTDKDGDAASDNDRLYTLTDQNAGSGSDQSAGSGRIFSITDDTAGADVIIADNGTNDGDGGSSSGSASSGNGRGSSASDSGSSGGGSGSGGNSGGGGGNGGSGTGGDDNGNVTPTPDPGPDPTPSPDPAPIPGPDPAPEKTAYSGTAREPAAKKDEMPDGENFGINYKKYTESDIAADKESASVIMTEASESSLYLGQTVDQQTIFNSLNTLVRYNGTIYWWGEDALDSYVRIAAVSFDDGASYTDAFPVVIPKDAAGIRIKAEYRFSTDDSSWTEYIVDYQPVRSRLLILNSRLTEDNVQLKDTDILNYEQYPDKDTIDLLLEYQYLYLGTSGELKELFPGWSENGEHLPWKYSITPGRHILEPEDKTELPEDYQAEIRSYYLTDDYRLSSSDQSADNLYFLQTLSFYSGVDGYPSWLKEMLEMDPDSGIETMSVPEHIQAVDFSADNFYEVETEELMLPASVLYYNADGTLRVKRAYSVADGSLRYSADDGILYDTEKTEICAVPEERETLTVSDTVRNIYIPEHNSIREIAVKSTDADRLTAVNTAYLSGCTVTVNEGMAVPFIKLNYNNVFKNTDNRLIVSGDPDNVYTAKNGQILRNESALVGIAAAGSDTFMLGSNIASIEKGAFEGTAVSSLIISGDAAGIQLKAGCFDNSRVSKIWCRTEGDAAYIRNELNRIGATGIEVGILQSSENGYIYFVSSETEDTAYITILQAPSDITVFDGSVDFGLDKTGEITVIADSAFAECTVLKWVTLPQSIVQIGANAFNGCTSLEGVLIDTRDTVSIGNNAFSGCDSLRFVASNALNAVMENGYDPIIREISTAKTGGNEQYCFYVPVGASGYGSYVSNMNDYLWFGDECIYEMEDPGAGDSKRSIGTAQGSGNDQTGDPGCRVLYGRVEGIRDLVIRAGSEIYDHTELTDTVTTICSYAFAGTRSQSGDGFSLNLDELNIEEIGKGAFISSELAGMVTVSREDNEATWVYVFGYAFAYCDLVTELKFNTKIDYLDSCVFSRMHSLEKISFSTLNDYSGYGAMISPDTFYGSNALKTIEFKDNIPALKAYSEGISFTFNDAIGYDEETQLHIVLPSDCEAIDAVKQWRYIMCGYSDVGSYDEYWNYNIDPAYLLMWNAVKKEHGCTDEEADEIVKLKLLDTEKHIRKLIGAEEDITEPSEFYPYRLDDTILTLTGAPSYIEELKVDAETIDMPDSWYIDYIAADAFAGTRLNKLELSDKLAGINETALGSDADELNIVFFADDEETFDAESCAPELILSESGTAFDFGRAEDSIHITLPEGHEDEFKEALIKNWVPPMAGYTDLMDIAMAVLDADGDADKEQEIQSRLFEAENRLLNMLGLDELSSMADSSFAYIFTSAAAEEEEIPVATPTELPWPDEKTDAEPETTGSGQEDRDSDRSDKEPAVATPTELPWPEDETDAEETDPDTDDEADKGIIDTIASKLSEIGADIFGSPDDASGTSDDDSSPETDDDSR